MATWKIMTKIGKSVIFLFQGTRSISLPSYTNGANWKNSMVAVYGSAISKIGNYLGFKTAITKASDNNYTIGSKYVENKRVVVRNHRVALYGRGFNMNYQHNTPYVSNVKFSNMEGLILMRMSISMMESMLYRTTFSSSISVNGETFGTATFYAGTNLDDMRATSLPKNTIEHSLTSYRHKRWSGDSFYYTFTLIMYVELSKTYLNGQNIDIRLKSFNPDPQPSWNDQEVQVDLISLGYIDRTNTKEADAQCLCVAFEKEI